MTKIFCWYHLLGREEFETVVNKHNGRTSMWKQKDVPHRGTSLRNSPCIGFNLNVSSMLMTYIIFSSSWEVKMEVWVAAKLLSLNTMLYVSQDIIGLSCRVYLCARLVFKLKMKAAERTWDLLLGKLHLPLRTRAYLSASWPQFLNLESKGVTVRF